MYTATWLLGADLLLRYWQEELERSVRRKLRANTTLKVKRLPGNDGPESFFKIIHNTRENDDKELLFSLGYKFSVPLVMIGDHLNIPDNIDVVIKRPDLLLDAPADINELTVYPESLDCGRVGERTQLKINCCLAGQMQRFTDADICAWWQEQIRMQRGQFLLAGSKINLRFDPRFRQPFRVRSEGININYRLVCSYSENLVIPDDNYYPLPQPTIVRKQNTILN